MHRLRAKRRGVFVGYHVSSLPPSVVFLKTGLDTKGCASAFSPKISLNRNRPAATPYAKGSGRDRMAG